MSEALSIDDFAAQLSQADQPEQPPVEDSDPDAVIDEESEGQPEGDEPEAEAQAEDEGDEQDEQPAEPESTEDRVVKWTTANGETFEVPETELQAGYMRQQDYTQKAQTLAEERRQAYSLLQQQIQEAEHLSLERGQLATLQTELSQYGQVDWQTLQAQDPDAYQQHVTRYLLLQNQAKGLEGQIREKRENLQAHIQRQTEMERAQRQQEAESHLVKVFKGVTREDTNAMFSLLRGKGASPEDLQALVQLPWAVELAMYAKKYMDLQASKPQAIKKVASVPQKAPSAQRTAPTKSDQLVKAATSKKALDIKTFAAALAATSKR